MFRFDFWMPLLCVLSVVFLFLGLGIHHGEKVHFRGKLIVSFVLYVATLACMSFTVLGLMDNAILGGAAVR